MRSYGDPCGIARALDLIGERWALLVVRELLHGPKRFAELRRGLFSASPNVLSQRLRELQQGGVVQRAGGGYELTARGRELHPLLLALGRWGARSTARPGGALSLDALLAALEATFLGMPGLSALYELVLEGERFTLEVQGPELLISRGAPRAALAAIETDPATLRAVVFGDRKLAGARLKLRGDEPQARRLLQAFARPR